MPQISFGFERGTVGWSIMQVPTLYIIIILTLINITIKVCREIKDMQFLIFKSQHDCLTILTLNQTILAVYLTVVTSDLTIVTLNLSMWLYLRIVTLYVTIFTLHFTVVTSDITMWLYIYLVIYLFKSFSRRFCPKRLTNEGNRSNQNITQLWLYISQCDFK